MKKQLSPAAKGFQKRQRRYVLTCIFLLLLTLVLAGMMMVYGNTIYSPKTVFQVLSGADINCAAFTIRTLRLSKNAYRDSVRPCVWPRRKHLSEASWKSSGKSGYHWHHIRSQCCCRVWYPGSETEQQYRLLDGSCLRPSCFLPDLFSFQGKWLFQCQADPHWYRNAGFSECGDFLDAFESFRI